MKKFFFLFLLFFSILNLFSGSIYKSNEIGQKIEKIDSLSSFGFEREDRENGFVLYKDGEIYQTREITELEKKDTFLDRIETELYSKTGLLERKIIEDINTGEKTEYNYRYLGSDLIGYTLTINDEVVSTVGYIRDEKGFLISIYEDTNSFLLSSGFGFISEDGPVFVRLMPSGVLVRDTFENVSSYSFFPDGSWQERIGQSGTINTYSQSGRLITSETGNTKESYEYSYDGKLVKKTIEDEDKLSIDTITDGKVNRSEVYKNNVLFSIKELQNDGTYYETRYEEGKEKYLLHYDRDGLRLMEIVRL